MFLFRVRKHLYVRGMFSPSFSERLSNEVAFLADSKMPRTTDLGIRLKMISIIISPLLFQHQPSNLKCLCIVIETTWVVITPNIWHFNVISPGGTWVHLFIWLGMAELSLWLLDFPTLDQITLNPNNHLLSGGQGQRTLSQTHRHGKQFPIT